MNALLEVYKGISVFLICEITLWSCCLLSSSLTSPPPPFPPPWIFGISLRCDAHNCGQMCVPILQHSYWLVLTCPRLDALVQPWPLILCCRPVSQGRTLYLRALLLLTAFKWFKNLNFSGNKMLMSLVLTTHWNWLCLPKPRLAASTPKMPFCCMFTAAGHAAGWDSAQLQCELWAPGCFNAFNSCLIS